MFVVKVLNIADKTKEIFNKKLNEFKSIILKKIYWDTARVVSDSNCLEFIAGDHLSEHEDGILIEFSIRKNILIKEEDLLDDERMRVHIKKIEEICDYACKVREVGNY